MYVQSRHTGVKYHTGTRFVECLGESRAEQVPLAVPARLLSTLSAHSLLEDPSITHYTAGREQHLKCTSLNSTFIFLPVALPEDLDHFKQMASLLSHQAFHQDPHCYSGSCWNVSHFLQSESAKMGLSYSYLKKMIQAIIRNGNIMEKQEM